VLEVEIQRAVVVELELIAIADRETVDRVGRLESFGVDIVTDQNAVTGGSSSRSRCSR
jgi:hypothetical protein